MPARPKQVTRKEHKSETAQVTTLRAVNGDKVVQLVASGMTITDAAKALEITRNMASKLLHDTLAETLAEHKADRDALLAKQLEGYRLLKRAWMPRALNPADDKAYQAAQIVLTTMDKENLLLGLNAAMKLEISNKRVSETVAEVVDLLGNADSDLPMILEAER